jgi:hypothetical protein
VDDDDDDDDDEGDEDAPGGDGRGIRLLPPLLLGLVVGEFEAPPPLAGERRGILVPPRVL